MQRASLHLTDSLSGSKLNLAKYKIFWLNFTEELAMISVSVGEAKNQLPKLLHFVEEGDEVEVTRHGKVVAYISGQSTSGERGTAFLQGIRAWRESYGALFEESEIEAIFNQAFQEEGGFLVRHGEDFL